MRPAPGVPHSVREEVWQWATVECTGCSPRLVTRVLRIWVRSVQSAAAAVGWCGSGWSEDVAWSG